MSRYAIARRVYYVEEPLFHQHLKAATVTMEPHGHLLVVTPQLPSAFTPSQVLAAQRSLLSQLIAGERISKYVLWYYTPLALRFSDHLSPDVVVYDCMDELSAFKNADPALPDLERALMRRADLVITGGQSLYEAKKHQHHNIHPMPSSVDVEHFGKARHYKDEPADQCAIARPRLGFFGVLDERLDIPLLTGLAEAKPDWQFVMIGPVVKIDPADLPRRNNIHYLGPKSYLELPRVHRRVGCRAAAVCAQRGHTVHQPDEDAGVPGRWQAGRLDVDPRCGQSVWRNGPGANCRHRSRVRRRL